MKNEETGQNKPAYFYWRSLRAVQEIQDRLAKCNSLIVYDLETTGINPIFHRIIEVAAIWLKKKDGRFVEENRMHRYFRLPENIPLPEEIEQLTGITREQLSKEMFEEDCLEDVMFFFEDLSVAGYNNLGFDDLFMQQYFYRNGNVFCPKASFDVLMMAHDFIQPEKIENFKLETVAKHFKIDAVQYHAAFSDAEVTVQLLNQFMECYQNGETALFCGTERPEINRISYWGKEGQENDADRPIRRIYVNLVDNPMKVFYDIPSGAWYTQSKSIDMAWLEERCWELLETANEEEFRAFRGSKKIRSQAA